MEKPKNYWLGAKRKVEEGTTVQLTCLIDPALGWGPWQRPQDRQDAKGPGPRVPRREWNYG